MLIHEIKMVQQFHHALGRGNDDDMIDFLIEKGADITAQDNNLNNSLHYALANIPYNPNAYKMMWKLIKEGCDMNLPNSDGQTPFGLVVTSTNYNGYHTYEEKKSRSLEKAKCIDKLIDYGADVTKMRRTPLSESNSFLDSSVFNDLFNTDAHFYLLGKGAVFTNDECVRRVAQAINGILITQTIDDDKKYIGVKALKKAIDNSKTLAPEIKSYVIREIDKTLAELKNPAFHSLVTKIKRGFDDEKVANRYKQIARDISSDYPQITLLREFGEGRITSRDFAMQEKIKKIFDDLSASIDAPTNSMSFVDRIKNAVGIKQPNKTHSNGEGGRGRGS